jgi:predicted NodU family carbamoyl transferase
MILGARNGPFDHAFVTPPMGDGGASLAPAAAWMLRLI